MHPIDDMMVFTTVVEAGSLTRGGERLGMSAAVVSKRLLKLEARLGVRLLHRTTRRLNTTEEGRIYFERCKTILEDIAELETALAGGRTEPRGTLRVTLPASFGRKHISPRLPEFLARHPGLTLELDLTDQVVDLIETGMDLGIRVGALADTDLVARRLAPSRRVLCASPDYLDRHGVPRTPKELRAHNCLLMSSFGSRTQIWSFRGSKGRQTVRVKGNFYTNNGETLRDAALAGLGIALKSTWDIAEDLQCGRLVAILTEYPLPPADIWAVYPHRRHLSVRVRVFVDFLHTIFGDEPYWDTGLSGLIETRSG